MFKGEEICELDTPLQLSMVNGDTITANMIYALRIRPAEYLFDNPAQWAQQN